MRVTAVEVGDCGRLHRSERGCRRHVHRATLIERGLLRYGRSGLLGRDRYYPDAGLRYALISRLQAVDRGLVYLKT